jgi:hypothetical protein
MPRDRKRRKDAEHAAAGTYEPLARICAGVTSRFEVLVYASSPALAHTLPYSFTGPSFEELDYIVEKKIVTE